MPGSTRIIRGESWGASLQAALVTPPEDIAAWMQQHTRILKSDTDSQVAMLQLRQQECYLKFYGYKSVRQQCLFRLGRGRPVRSFDVARKLIASEVPVPSPRACLLVPGGMLLLTEGISGGRNLNDLWREQLPGDTSRQLLQSAGESIAQLHRAGFAHGDCKWSNLLWSGQQLFLVDLDAACKALYPGTKQARDLARFTLNAEELGVTTQLYEHFLGSYLRGFGGSRKEAIERMLPILRKLRGRHVARYGQCGQPLF